MNIYMQNINLMHESITNNFQSVSLSVITILSIACGIFVIVSKNPIVSVLYLIGLFLSVALYLMLQGLNFIGLAYLLVYVGAVSILFLFILMLINVRISEIVSSTSNSIPLGILTGTVLYTVISKAFPNHLNHENLLNLDLILSTRKSEFFLDNFITFFNVRNEMLCNIVTSPSWDSTLTYFSHIGVIGNVLYTVYPLWLLLTSLVLLLAMVGTIVITIKS